ncbi:MAG: prolyl oligopeptidase family serine peptidase [Bacteroidaceae bacterium]|nr:prolyl oligopeptidase family serine peptidase [Bacteroidaceae bacterium]
MTYRLLLFSALIVAPISMHAQEDEFVKGADVQKVVAHTSVDDWGLVIHSLDVTVSNPKVLSTLKASDFDITNNVANTMYDSSTGEAVKDYPDDEISFSYEGSVLHIKARPFDAEGKRGERFQKEPWKVTCSNPALSFTADAVDDRTIDIIDDCIHGSYTFGGLTREYMLYLPKDEQGNTIKNVPLFVWQIGGGEYDKDMMTAALANRCLVSLPQHNQKVATLVFAIANPNYTYSASLYPEKIELIDRNNALQMAFIDELIANGTVDGSRLFCAGASSGGGCTMRFMMQFANRFKAAIPCCAMDPIVPIHKVEEKYDGQWLKDVTAAFQGKVYKWNGTDMELQDMDTQAFVNLPMYFVHAQDDQTCKVASSHVYFNARKDLGAKNDKIQIYSDADMKAYGFGGFLAHFSWCRLLNDYTPGSAMDWLVKMF